MKRDILNTDLSYYKLYVAGSHREYDDYNIRTTVDLHLRNKMAQIDPKLDDLMLDMEVMNSVRSSEDPAVKAEYEQLLTVMELTRGRTSFGAQCRPMSGDFSRG